MTPRPWAASRPRGPALDATLRRLALEAGAAVMAVYRGADPGATAKRDGSPLTDADLAADAIIAAGLSAAYPDIPVVTEERVASHALGAGGVHFLVDPLDGTREFLSRNGEFTVNVALVEDGAPTAGVVYAPALDRLFRTDAATGGAVEERDLMRGEPVRRRLWPAQADRAALRVVASRSHRDPATEAYLARRRAASVVAVGSSLKFCLIAAGEADLYPRFGPTMEWDTAAGQAVLEAAGGFVARADDGAPLRYGKPGRANPAFVAQAAGLRDVAGPPAA